MSDTPVKSKELLYCWVASCFNVLVPKRRGEGFLKVPYGHHPDAMLDVIARAAKCDLFGLDGSLEFECSGKVFHGGDEARAEFAAIVVPRLEVHYGVRAREVTTTEFWALHPVPSSTQL